MAIHIDMHDSVRVRRVWHACNVELVADLYRIYIHACMHTYVHMYIHTYIHIRISYTPVGVQYPSYYSQVQGKAKDAGNN